MTDDRPAAHVFVYGTLTDPDRVETVLASVPGARFELACEASLEGLHRIEGVYPTLAPGGRVDGKLLAINGVGLDALDRYEGVDRRLYERIPVPSADESTDRSLWVYVGDPDRLGVAERVDCPTGSSFVDRVRTYVSRNEVRVRRRE